ncbi:YvrJ family protein [Bacillus sp. FSL R9-9410]|uniref:YvrJ family protein n=1 Tax=Bacillus sp. FSL R9-9410 TaxID=2921590 RepID=UPI003100AAC0
MEPTHLEPWFSAIGNFGFPVVLAVYLLIRFEKKLERLTEAIETLKDAIRSK